jgi:hypothetical protein
MKKVAVLLCKCRNNMEIVNILLNQRMNVLRIMKIVARILSRGINNNENSG